MNSNSLILLIEPVLDEALLIQAGLKGAGILNPVYSLREAAQAQEYLARLTFEGEPAQFPRAAIVSANAGTLDFIRWVRRESPAPSLLIILLAHREQGAEVRQALEEGANIYHFKGAHCATLAAIFRELDALAPPPESRAEMPFREVFPLPGVGTAAPPENKHSVVVH